MLETSLGGWEVERTGEKVRISKSLFVLALLIAFALSRQRGEERPQIRERRQMFNGH